MKMRPMLICSEGPVLIANHGNTTICVATAKTLPNTTFAVASTSVMVRDWFMLYG